jgi:hypothetical protein
MDSNNINERSVWPVNPRKVLDAEGGYGRAPLPNATPFEIGTPRGPVRQHEPLAQHPAVPQNSRVNQRDAHH